MEKFLNKHQALILLVGGIMATLVSITVFAYTNFQTKASSLDERAWINQRFDSLDKRFDRLEDKLDKLTKE